MEEVAFNRRWWSSKDLAADVQSLYRHLRDADEGRLEDIRRNLRLYSNTDVVGINPHNYSKRSTNERASWNLIKAVCDTSTSKVAKARIQPFFATEEGNHSNFKKARYLERFVLTKWAELEVHAVMPRVFLDAAVFGTGFLKVFREGKKIQIERVFCGEVFVDSHDALTGCPRSLFQRKFISKERLKAIFPKMAAKIEKLQRKNEVDYDEIGYDSATDQLVVIEAWHLRSGPDADDGVHAIVCEDLVLHQGEWKYDYFPFIRLAYSEPLLGYYGTGLSDELVGVQRDINQLLSRISRSMHALGVPWVLVPDGSRLKKAHLNNEIGAIIPFTGAPPVVRPNQTVHPEVFMHLDRLWGRGFEIAGLSAESGASMVPAGLRSGIGLRTHHAIESQRFSIIMRQYEWAHRTLALRIIALGKEIYDEYGEYKVVAQKDRYTITQVDWKDVDMEADAYIIKVFPASSLPDEPGGKLDMVAELQQMGVLSTAQVNRLLDMPDLENEVSLDRAASDNIDRIMEKILDDGKYEPPEPMMDLTLALKKAQAHYNRAKARGGVPEKHLQLLRQWMIQVNELRLQSQVPAEMAEGLTPPGVDESGMPVTAVRPEDGML